MSVARESFALPALFLTVAWLGGFRMAGSLRFVPPPLIALALAMLLVGCLARAGVLRPERLMNSRRTALENLSGLVVVLSLFAACAQVFNLVTPETGLLHLLFSLFFLVQLLTTLAAVRNRVLMLRGLAVLLGSAFLIRFVALEALYSTDGGTLQRVLTVLMEGITLGALEYEPNAPVTGYVAFLVLVLFLTGLILLEQGGGSDELPELPGLPELPKLPGLPELPGSRGSSQLQMISRRSSERTAVAVAVGRGPVGAAIGLLVVLFAGCSSSLAPGSASNPPDTRGAAAREAALASARVWRQPATPIGQAALDRNPPGGWAPTDEVECGFVADGASGTTPKFDCQLPDGEIVKVKYGKANEELYSEVAATRLLTALGFGADEMFVVRRVRCGGCPPYPFLALRCFDRTGARWPCFAGGFDYKKSREFDYVTIERKMAGRRIEAVTDQGWAWFELERIDPDRGGSPRAEVDALRLMAMVLAHWDNKAANQRLICLPGGDRADGSCATPLAIIQDLGAAFGPRKVDLGNWRQVPIWADPRECRVSMQRLPWGGGTFPDHQISEEGRAFLLRLLEQLSPAQLEVLFVSSRITAYEAPGAGSRDPRKWVGALLDKIRQIREAGPCRSLSPLVPDP